jgi:hypothetical protein
MYLGRNAKRAESSDTLVSAPVGLLDNVTTLSTRLAFTMLDIPRHLPPPDREPAHRSASQPGAAESAGKPSESCRKLRTRSDRTAPLRQLSMGRKPVSRSTIVQTSIRHGRIGFAQQSTGAGQSPSFEAKKVISIDHLRYASDSLIMVQVSSI